ncbi:MAG TPA: 50S ribosomal protein L6 [Bacteroidia bacterium]|nr:50S ribosomal protein L6 [Bacteroidia bacterium]HNT80245.1 50S ribosomal protein L6 [Bacteroidia bacterium]
MSRIGNAPIEIPKGVEVNIAKNNVTVKGPKGNLSQKLGDGISATVDAGVLTFTRATEQKRHRALHGLYRALVANMVKGVSEGFKIEQELVGVGYRATAQGQVLDLVLGYSHHVIFELPDEIKVATRQEKGQNPIITLESADKQLLGTVSAKIRSLRKPEPFKGKGIKYVGETLRRKAGKSAAKK